LQTVSNINQ